MYFSNSSSPRCSGGFPAVREKYGWSLPRRLLRCRMLLLQKHCHCCRLLLLRNHCFHHMLQGSLPCRIARSIESTFSQISLHYLPKSCSLFLLTLFCLSLFLIHFWCKRLRNRFHKSTVQYLNKIINIFLFFIEQIVGFYIFIDILLCILYILFLLLFAFIDITCYLLMCAIIVILIFDAF